MPGQVQAGEEDTSKEGTVRYCQSKKANILWSHHDKTRESRELYGERVNAMNNARPSAGRRGRHSTAWMDYNQYVDRTARGRISQNDRG